MRTFERIGSALVGTVEWVADWRPVRYFQVGAYGFLVGFASGPFVEPDVGGLLAVGTWFASTAAYRVADVRREQRSPAAVRARRAAAAAAKLDAIEQAYLAENARLQADSARKRKERRAEHTLWEWSALEADGGVMQRPTGQPRPASPKHGRHPLLWEQAAGGWQRTSLGDQLHAMLHQFTVERRAFHYVAEQARNVQLLAWLRGQQTDGSLPDVSDTELLAMLEHDADAVREFVPWGYGGAPYPQQPYPPGNSTPKCWCMIYGWNAKTETIREHTWFTHTRPRPLTHKEPRPPCKRPGFFICDSPTQENPAKPD